MGKAKPLPLILWEIYTKSSATWRQGQMLIELLVSLSIVALVLVALTSGTVMAIRNAKFAQDLVLANQYAQEALEVVRKERDQASSWEVFINDPDGYNEEECLDGTESCSPCILPLPSPLPSANVGIFYRCLYFDNAEADIAAVKVLVAWSEGGKNHNVQSATILSKWGN